MNKHRFQKLTFKEKVQWIYFNGEFVTSIRYYKYKVNLYLLDRLYIELFYNNLEDAVEKIEVLDERSKRMNFYTDQIKLPRL
ncbi:hypothetical protein [Marinoscillum sp. MHG1-6]|uniref:hypothetical protein n=1 Tax=Marinoscillum sp. MHG1-6 TaxID=2959627 RepID=UPI0021577B69|nr:hypothetical protein [Marinoscillum sp. MHG1-6]